MEGAFSVDLEPNKDGSLDGVAEAMTWFDDIVPRGTVFVTERIAQELPDTVAMLSKEHELGVHVHPREFGHDHDQFARLDTERQGDLIERTQESIAAAARCDESEITAFRAGRHSCSETTFQILAAAGFETDASLHVRYDEFLPEEFTNRPEPFTLESGLREVPTTFLRPRLLSPLGIRIFPQRTITATAATLRGDHWRCSGCRAIRALMDRRERVSLYMHPYDASNYHGELENVGSEFRRRFEAVIDNVDRYRTISEIATA